MPGAVPRTSTIALTNATLPYALKIAGEGWRNACRNDNALKKGLNIINGNVVYKGVADAFNLKYLDIDTFL
jgi:alanine dehydrogenase